MNTNETVVIIVAAQGQQPSPDPLIE